MKDNIKPMWEDENNKKGGGFSFKIHNKNVEYVWKRLFYALVGGTITTNKKVYDNITGISLSPKKSFCIIKIWMRNCENLNHNVFIDIDYLDKKGCLFKKHETD
jgi:translation initiation factor 4E